MTKESGGNICLETSDDPKDKGSLKVAEIADSENILLPSNKQHQQANIKVIPHGPFLNYVTHFGHILTSGLPPFLLSNWDQSGGGGI